MTVAYAEGEDEDALAFSGVPTHAYDEATPGFYLADDAGGRFVIDHETGIISVFNEALVAREFGAVHVALVRVIERDGGGYDFPIRLRITGPIPQTADETPALPPPAATDDDDDTPPTARRPFSARAWALYAAARAAPGHDREPAPPYTFALPALLPETAPAALDLALDAACPSAFVAWSARRGPRHP